MRQLKFGILLILLIPKIGLSQIPVTDAAAGGTLTAIKVGSIKHMKLTVKMIANQREVIANQNQLIKLMQEQNRIAKHTDELKSEEIKAYKEAPDNRLISYQKQMLTFEKKKIIEQIKLTISSLREMKYVSEKSKTELKKYLKNMALQVAVMWKQTSNVLAINDKIIPASERQTLLEKTIRVFGQCVSEIEDKEIHLSIMNKEIKSRKELFGF